MNGGAVKRYLRDAGGWREETGASLTAMRVVMEEIANWQQGRFDANPHFQASLSTDPEPRVTLVPREPSWGKMIRRIELTLSREQAGVMKGVRLVEDERSFTDLSFSQVRTQPAPAGFPVCERGMNAMPRRLFPLFLLLLTVVACTGLKPLKPLDPARKPAVLEGCRRPFLPGKYRLVHALETVMPDGAKGTAIGVLVADPRTRGFPDGAHDHRGVCVV